MISIYVRYHIDRFRQYLLREEGELKRQMKNMKLLESFSFMFAAGFLFLYAYSLDGILWVGSVVFWLIGLIIHLIRDYNKGNHIGWNRKKKKEESMYEK